jgi:hypothetical protein
MKGMEIMGWLWYSQLIIQAIDYGLTFLALDGKIANYHRESNWNSQVFPKCITDADMRQKVLGRIIEWYVIEVTVAFAYLITMMFLMIKSRYKLIGGDQSA